ncbi:MAG: RdgB/HAM1 family non-canonical purine NTP pyrophosphatase [Calditrichaeota bacterium]|nr:MAG: RdgB/HAM1 family non-canonical purine NTP pyrophosphatase [Calditrichota bacterium]MBL1208076.1 RdgB/HAM1 family non-canonical purine NTP pyrophosphatase [Calditrichota bacterium]NOG47914.1 RdgB/HAM1 family non-canonical purine NTP pyrophosphatase [Calditrichota bacterium]
MKIIFATTNDGKAKEVAHLIQLPYIELTSLNSIKEVYIPKVEETGQTFLDNALIKARAYFDTFKQAVIADDSGLIVPALNNEPGVHSARYAGENATYLENNSLLIKNITSIPDKQRQAFFKSVIVYKDQFQEKVFEGICNGRIIEKPVGTNGFGYDPLFYIDELQKTFAQLNTEEKNKISHRGKAINELKKFLKKLNN